MTSARFRNLGRAHPLVVLKGEFEDAKDIPERVRKQVASLFRAIKNPKEMTEDQAILAAHRLGCHIQWLRTQHDLMQMSPLDRGWLNLSKSAALWASLRDKLKGSNGHGGHGPSGKMPGPTSPLWEGKKARHEEPEPDSGNGVEA